MFGNTKIIPVFASHRFEDVSFIKPKKCDYCKGLLIKKGSECADCQITVHRGKCFDRAKLLLCGGSSVTVAEVPQNDSIAVTVENCIPESHCDLSSTIELPSPRTDNNNIWNSEVVENCESSPLAQSQTFTLDSIVEQLTEKEIALKEKLNETRTVVHQLEQSREFLLEDIYRLKEIITSLQQMGYT